jgi:hypothetical protein
VSELAGRWSATLTCQLPLRSAGCRRLQDVERGGDAGDLPLLGQRRLQAFEIAGGFVHVRLRTSTRTMRVAGSMVIGARGGGLAHDLAVDLAFGGHVDDDVALNGGLAAEAAALGRPRTRS